MREIKQAELNVVSGGTFGTVVAFSIIGGTLASAFGPGIVATAIGSTLFEGASPAIQGVLGAAILFGGVDLALSASDALDDYFFPVN